MKRVIVLVDRQGKLTLETQGYTGADCQVATRELEAALGAAESETLKPEFYQVTQAAVDLSLRQGRA